MKDDKSNIKAYWILGIFGIIFIALWSYFDPGDRILFPDKSKQKQEAEINKVSQPQDTTAQIPSLGDHR